MHEEVQQILDMKFLQKILECSVDPQLNALPLLEVSRQCASIRSCQLKL